jgi:hypothetical protein
LIFLSGSWGLWMMNLWAWTCKWMRGLPEEDGRLGLNKKGRPADLGRPA